MSKEETPQDLAKQLYRAFETHERADKEKYVCLVDGSPEWMTDVVRAAHGDMMPDDTRYCMIREVVGELADRDPEEWEDAAHEICDGLVDIYTSRLTAWLASHLDRVGYVTQAIAEYGRGSGPENEIAMGQFLEYEEIYFSLVRSLTDLAEEIESDDDDESED